MDNLNELISQAIELKQGNREFALFFDGAKEWQAHVGNPTNCVGLGEVSGDVVGVGSSPEGALLDLVQKLSQA